MNWRTIILPLCTLVFSICVSNALRASALHDAIKDHDADRAIQLINADTVDSLVEGNSPLHVAIEYDLIGVVIALIENGANINLPSSSGELPTSLARERGKLRILQILSPLALHQAIEQKDSGTALMVMGQDNINAFVNGKAPIHAAVENSLDEVVLELINRGADINLPSLAGMMPAEFAYRLPDKKIYEILTKWGGSRERAALSGKQDDISLSRLIHSEVSRDLFPYSYPLLCSDGEIFQKLKRRLETGKIASWQVMDMISTLVDEDFPGGLLSMPARRALDDLLATIDATPRMIEKVHSVLFHQLNSLPLGNKPEPELTLNWQQRRNQFIAMDINSLADDITIYETQLLQKITLRQLAMWLADDKAAESLTEYSDFTNKLRLFFGFVLVKDHEGVQENAQRLLKLGRRFLKMGNFSGVQTLVATFANPSISRVLLLNKKSQKKLAKLAESVDAHRNYGVYRDTLSKFAHKPALPLLALHLRDLRTIYETKPDTITIPWLTTLAESGRTLSRLVKKASRYLPEGRMQVADFLKEMPPINDDVIDAFCYSEKPDDFAFLLSLKTRKATMRNCSASELVKCFRDIQLPMEVAQCLLNAEIWSGADLEKLLSQTDSKAEQKAILMKIGLGQVHAEFLRYNLFTSCSFDV